jgi:myo-inositol catabolism protein IolS
MRYRPISRSRPEIKVSEIGFGCWTLGGPNWSLSDGNPIGWKDVVFEEALAGVRAGIEAGVNHWDNADIYGNGKAERILRDCFKSLGVKRDAQVIATKVGHFRGTAEHAYHPFHIRRQCEQSLINLGTDYIDIYYFHHGSFGERLHEAAATMHALVKEGKVRAVGQSAYSDDDFERSAPVVKPDVLQSWASMLRDNFIRPGARLQTLMSERGIGFVAFSPLAQGLLLDKFDPESPPKFEDGDIRGNNQQFKSDALRALKPKVAKLKERFGASVEDLASAACRFVLAHPNVVSAIPGFRNEAQARCNLRGATDAPMSADEAAFCRGIFA